MLKSNPNHFYIVIIYTSISFVTWIFPSIITTYPSFHFLFWSWFGVEFGFESQYDILTNEEMNTKRISDTSAGNDENSETFCKS